MWGRRHETQTVAISGRDRLDELEALFAAGNLTQELEEEWYGLDNGQRAQAQAAWWVVSWPEHVLRPRYNSDAYYHYFGDDREGAIATADAVYGD